MAYTIISTPPMYYPVYNQMIMKVSSGISDSTNHRFMFQIYDRTGNMDKLLSIQRVPVSPDGYGYCDISKILKNYISYQPGPNISGITVSQQACLPYKVLTGEEISGAFVTNVENISTKVLLTISGYNTNKLNGKKLSYLILPGLTLSASTFYIKFNATKYEVYSDAAMTMAVTATGSFSANGALQTTDNYIPATISDFIGTTELLAINAVKQYDEILDWNNGSDYKTADNHLKFLTNSPRIKGMVCGDTCHGYGYETLAVLQAADENIDVAEYRFYDIGNNLLGVYTLPNTNTVGFSGGSFTNAQNSRIEIPTGFQNLLDAGVTGAIPDHYTVQCYNATGATVTELFTYYIIDSCNKQYDPMRLIWLNSLGGTDSFSFKMITDNGLAIIKQDYRKVLPFGYTSQDRGETVYHTDAIQTWTLSSDYIDTAEAEWLAELFISPEVFIINGSKLTPVVVQDKNYTYKIKGKEKLKKVNVTVMGANKRIING